MADYLDVCLAPNTTLQKIPVLRDQAFVGVASRLPQRESSGAVCEGVLVGPYPGAEQLPYNRLVEGGGSDKRCLLGPTQRDRAHEEA